ncbi:MAG: metallophosphoesterase [Acidobacteria bacterium]|nr:metallophosphoesterase [Acidobacteriota bacterium]
MKMPRRRLLRLIGLLFIAAAACLAYSYFFEPHRLVVRNAEIRVKGLDRTLDGLQITVISDIHAGSNAVDHAYIENLVQTVNAQNADLIVILGDFVAQTHSAEPAGRRALRMPVDEIGKALSGLHANIGVFAVLGNHDGWYSDDEVAAALSRNGIRVLQNEIAAVQYNGTAFRLLGLRDHMHIKTWSRWNTDIEKVVTEAGGSGDLIVLEHSPDVLPIMAGSPLLSSQMRLFLAGHTHGGQVWLPILGRPMIPSSYGQKFAYGHIREKGIDMFVTSGVGTSILPFRFMVPPEIVVLILRPEQPV